MTITEIKSYLRVDGSDNDVDLSAFLLAATKYINGKTGKSQVNIVVDGLVTTADISTDELYNLCIKIMVAHWFENRGVEIVGTLTKITHSVDSIVNHIAMSGDYV